MYSGQKGQHFSAHHPVSYLNLWRATAIPITLKSWRTFSTLWLDGRVFSCKNTIKYSPINAWWVLKWPLTSLCVSLKISLWWTAFFDHLCSCLSSSLMPRSSRNDRVYELSAHEWGHQVITSGKLCIAFKLWASEWEFSCNLWMFMGIQFGWNAFCVLLMIINVTRFEIEESCLCDHTTIPMILSAWQVHLGRSYIQVGQLYL